jgi:hypothetical protein
MASWFFGTPSVEEQQKAAAAEAQKQALLKEAQDRVVVREALKKVMTAASKVAKTREAFLAAQSVYVAKQATASIVAEMAAAAPPKPTVDAKTTAPATPVVSVAAPMGKADAKDEPAKPVAADAKAAPAAAPADTKSKFFAVGDRVDANWARDVNRPQWYTATVAAVRLDKDTGVVPTYSVVYDDQAVLVDNVDAVNVRPPQGGRVGSVLANRELADAWFAFAVAVSELRPLRALAEGLLLCAGAQAQPQQSMWIKVPLRERTVMQRHKIRSICNLGLTASFIADPIVEDAAAKPEPFGATVAWRFGDGLAYCPSFSAAFADPTIDDVEAVRAFALINNPEMTVTQLAPVSLTTATSPTICI